MKTEKKCEDFTRVLFKKGKEIMELAKKAEVGPGISAIRYDIDGDYVNVELRTEHGDYEMSTINGSRARLRFTEKGVEEDA